MTSQATADELQFTAETIIADAIEQGSHVANVFIRYRMYCIGCAFARFENLGTAAVNHRVDVEEFLNALNAAVCKPKAGSQAGDPATTNQFKEEA